MTQMICPRCKVNEFEPWAAKDKGQKFPFKSCPDCREKRRAEMSEQGNTPPQYPKTPQEGSQSLTGQEIIGDRVATALEKLNENIEALVGRMDMNKEDKDAFLGTDTVTITPGGSPPNLKSDYTGQ